MTTRAGALAALRCCLLAGCALGCGGCFGEARPAHPAPPPTWTANGATRLAALALLESLNAELLSHDSATLTLERWCAAHRLASPPVIVAQRSTAAEQPPSPEQRAELGVAAGELVRYRHVRLTCGTKVLSEADNWYVPGRLTPDMNARLDGSDAPFGKVVQPLHFVRHTLAATLLWRPLPELWEMDPSSECASASLQPMPAKLLQHRAILSLPDGTPFSEVVETYTDAVLDFPIPTMAAPLCP
jgi:hypothetical protein